MRRVLVASLWVWMVGCFSGGGEPATDATADAQNVAVPDGSAPTSPGPANKPDVGPGGLSPDVVTAYKTLAPDGRLVRCTIPEELNADMISDGPLSGQITQTPHDALTLPRAADGWFSAVVPVDSHTATLVRGERAVGMVTWRRAVAGQWNECTVLKAYPYSVVGRVTDASETPIVKASVIGCSADKPVLTDKDGRFDLPGVFGRSCVVVAFVRDAAGLGYSPPSIIDSGGVDALLDVVVPESRITPAEEQTKLTGALAVAEDRVTNGIAREVTDFKSRLDSASMPEGARAVADLWLKDLSAREAAARAHLTAAEAGGKDALLTLPAEAF